MIGDVVRPRSRAELEAWLNPAAGLAAWQIELIQAALAAGEGSDAWSLAEFELGTLEQP